MSGVDQHGRQVEQSGGTQFGEQCLVQLLPDPGLLPLGQPPPARGAGGAEQGRGQPVPADAGAHDVEDALQRSPVIRTPSTWIAEASRMCRYQRLKPRPQLVGQDLLTHPVMLEHQTLQPKPTRQLILN